MFFHSQTRAILAIARLTLFFFLIGGSESCAQNYNGFVAPVFSVTTPDTLMFQAGGGEINLHLYGVEGNGVSDADRETGRKYLLALLGTQEVRLVVQAKIGATDYAGEVIYIDSSGKSQRLSEHLLRLGYVRLKPRRKHSPQAVAAEKVARMAQLGYWRMGKPVLPAKPAPPVAQRTLLFSKFEDEAQVGAYWVSSGFHNTEDEYLGLQAATGFFPIVYTRTNPFPSGKQWSVSFGYRFRGAPLTGISLACVSRKTGKVIATISQHAEDNLQYISLGGGQYTVTTPLSLDVFPPFNAVSFVRTGDLLSVYVDGEKRGEVQSADDPDAIVMGSNDYRNLPNDSRLDVQIVRVDSGQYRLRNSELRDVDYVPRINRMRGELARLGMSAYTSQPGQVGQVNSLYTQGLTGGTDLFTVNAFSSSSPGFILLNRISGLSIRTAVDNAYTWARSNFPQAKSGLQWEQAEVVMAHEGTDVRGGNSAGITYATAIASMATNRPVNQSVAMTGAITLQGTVQGVGGVDFKAVGALRAGMTTLIVPAKWSSAGDIERVRRIDPLAFCQCRLIYADNMEQVLRQSLNGYDPEIPKAMQLMRRGMNQFAIGEYKVAATFFRAAVDIMPEDRTAGNWLELATDLDNDPRLKSQRKRK